MNITDNPYSFIQAVVDTHYSDVLANATASGLVTGDVGEEALYDAIATAFESGNYGLVENALDVSINPENLNEELGYQFARLIPRKKFMGPPMEDGNYVSNTGGGSGWQDNVDEWATTAANIFATIWGATQGGNDQPGTTDYGPIPDYTDTNTEMDNTTMLMVGGAFFFVLIILAVILRK